MDAISDPLVHTVVVMKSAQVGYTEILLNVIGYHIEHDPASILIIQPNVKPMGESFAKDRIAPMLRDSPSLRGKVADPRSRDSGNTILHKVFPSGHLTVAGANAPAGLASRPIRVVLCDEVDRYPPSAGPEGDPIRLAQKRQTTYWNRKTFIGGTPTIKGSSRTEFAYEASDRRQYHVPCPHCGEYHALEWHLVRWPEGQPKEAGHVCPHCGALAYDRHKRAMLAGGRWVSREAFKGVAGFHLSELYSPWVRWSDMAADFLEAKRDTEQLKTFVNTSLGETWETPGEQLDPALLRRRREDIERIPAGYSVITVGVDVQQDRLELEVCAWGTGERSIALDYRVLWGDPQGDQVWRDLDLALEREYRHDNGALVKASIALIDSGYLTDFVYAYVAPRQGRRIFAAKGNGDLGRPIVGAPRPQKASGGRQVQLFTVGTDEAKGVILARLQAAEQDIGHCRFTSALPDEYFEQLCAERAQTRYVRGFAVREWVKTRPRNEALDCRVLNLAAIRILQPDFEAIEAALQPKDRTTKPKQPKKPGSLTRRGL